MKSNKNYIMSEHDGINNNDLLTLYDLLCQKSQSKIFLNRAASQSDVLISGKDCFSELPIEIKVKTIYEILHLFQCRFISADLGNIKGSHQAGVFTVSKKISNAMSAKLINQSATGLFEQEIDLLTV